MDLPLRRVGTAFAESNKEAPFSTNDFQRIEAGFRELVVRPYSFDTEYNLASALKHFTKLAALA